LKQIAAGFNVFTSILPIELFSFKELAVNSEGNVSELKEGNDLVGESEHMEEDANEEDLSDLQSQDRADSTQANNELTKFLKIVDELHTFPPLR